MIRLFLSALAATLISATCYGSESLRERIANHDWSAFVALDDDGTNLGELPAQKNFRGLKRDTFDFLGAILINVPCAKPLSIQKASQFYL